MRRIVTWRMKFEWRSTSRIRRSSVQVEVKVLTSPDVRDHNSSERPELISPISSNVEVMYNKLTYTLPPHSVGVFQLRL